MTDVKSVLRYVLPGLGFVIELVLLLHLAGRGGAISELLKDMGDASGLVAAVGAVVAAGGIGFLLSIVHFALFDTFGTRWDWLNSCYPSPTYTDLLESDATKEDKRIQRIRERIAGKDKKTLTPQQTRQILREFNHGAGKKWYKEHVDRTGNLSDTMHSVGAAYVGSMVACAIVLLCIAHETWDALDAWGLHFYWGGLWAALIGAVLTLCHWCTYRNTVRNVQSLVGAVSRRALEESGGERGQTSTPN